MAEEEVMVVEDELPAIMTMDYQISQDIISSSNDDNDDDDNDDDQYLLRLSEQVFNNDLILDKVFANMSVKELSRCCLVCHKWLAEAYRVLAARSRSLFIYHLIRAEQPTTTGQTSLAVSVDTNSSADDELDYCSRVDWSLKYDFKANVIKRITDGLYSIPELCLLVYGSLGEDVKMSQRLYHTDIVRRYLPPNGCNILNLNSQCLIGRPTTSSVPIHKISHFGDLAAVSMLLLPKYRSGIDITVFTGADMPDKLFTKSDIKSILLFTTSSIFQDNRQLFREINTLSKFITTTLNGRIAFGGYNSAYFSFNRKDFLNYLVDNNDNNFIKDNNNNNNNNEEQIGDSSSTSSGLHESDLVTRELIGLCFSGQQVRASSLLLNTKRLTKTEAKIRKFKNSLGFDINVNNNNNNNKTKNQNLSKFSELIAFMFTDEDKADAYLKLQLFQSVFGNNCQVIGISGYGQYGFNYWPSIDDTIVNNKTNNMKINNNNNNNKRYVNNNRRQQQQYRKCPRIVLNTNMTTFVVISLQK
ncbi:putative uncharacterized protein DDB_G0282133 [Oppia nitens]|uniref:putative uncharacterized protein DDB_G0282133 n=1 Tax=Oppia nitens TaxID=1686743 RepID=UPI0023DC2058|nr:putative uncharacterized protein DDB_G0282133 [Oppia nitens]